MLLDRHRMAQLIELSAAEQKLSGPERQIRAEDVKTFIKAAFDDATDAARAEFMTRVGKMPGSAWPWSAVQVGPSNRGGGGGGGGGLGVGGKVIVAVPGGASAPKVPAALVLLRGQADAADVDPAHRLPDPGTPEAAEWELFYKALDTWNTAEILGAIGPLGWVSMMGTSTGDVPKDTDDDAATSGAPADGIATGDVPASEPTPEPAADLVPAPTTEPTVPLWKRPVVVVVAGATTLAAGVALYRMGRRAAEARAAQQLSDRIRREGGA